MAGTAVSDNLLTGGTNQGVERTVLPMPQLDIAFNVRLRKASRWGKRFGHTALSTTNLGNGTGDIRCTGGALDSCFCVTDDRCSNYDQAAAAFVLPKKLGAGYVAGAVSGWLPDTSFFPVPPASLQRQTVTPCAVAYGIGYLWSAISYTNPAVATDKAIRVVATNPTDQTIVFQQDITATITTFGGVFSPKLVVCGSTVILTYLYTSAAGNTTVNGRILTTIAGGFGADTNIDPITTIANYDIGTYDSTQFMMVSTRPAGTMAIRLITASSLAIAGSKFIADGSGNPITSASIAGNSTAVFVAYGMVVGTTTRVIVHGSAFGFVVGTITVSAGSGEKPLLALMANGNVRVVHSPFLTTSVGAFTVTDVTPAAAITGTPYNQSGVSPISFPFAVGALVYMWARLEVRSAADGHFPLLIRLPTYSEFGTLPGNGVVTCPLELAVQDFPVGLFAGTIDQGGIPKPVQIGATASYAVIVPNVYSPPPDSGLIPGFDFRVLQTKHFTDSANRRGLNAIYADSTSFVPMGTLLRIDDRGPVEEGFAYSPAVASATPAAGGLMTASSDYYYSCIFKSRNSNGRFEQSAPTVPLKVTMAALQTQVTLSLTALYLGARDNAQIEIYRTLSNTQTFYLAGIVDASQRTGAFISFVDGLADLVLQNRQALYTQVGQQLPNAFPPASRFGCVGGQRLYLGGLMRPDVVQASKLIFGDQSPSFADSDAFRIVLPAPCTGVAWMDVLVMFTAEGIYIASGDGPTDDGVGDFGNLTRMPYELGCIEPRSVKVVNDGCFFQTSRGLYLLPRGFGAPVAAGDNVMTSLISFPVITGVATITKKQEQSVLWTCSNTGGSQGLRIAYDLTHKTWTIDSFADSTGSGAAPCGIGQWLGGEIAQFGATTAQGLQVSDNTFADPANTPIQMEIRTGDIRPFGATSEGVLNKLALLAELRSACTLNIGKITNTSSFTSNRVFALAGGDAQVGDVTIVETEIGSTEQRNATALRVQYDETSTTEGLAFVALSLEHEKGEGMARIANYGRNT